MDKQFKFALARLHTGTATIKIEPVHGAAAHELGYALIVDDVEVGGASSYTAGLESSIQLVNNIPLNIIELSEDETRILKSLSTSTTDSEIVISRFGNSEKMSLCAVSYIAAGDERNIGLFIKDESSSVSLINIVTPQELLEEEFIEVGDNFIIIPAPVSAKKDEVIEALLGSFSDYHEDFVNLMDQVYKHARENGNEMPTDFKEVLSYGFDIDPGELDAFYRWLILKEVKSFD